MIHITASVKGRAEAERLAYAWGRRELTPAAFAIATVSYLGRDD